MPEGTGMQWERPSRSMPSDHRESSVTRRPCLMQGMLLGMESSRAKATQHWRGGVSRGRAEDRGFQRFPPFGRALAPPLEFEARASLAALQASNRSSYWSPLEALVGDCAHWSGSMPTTTSSNREENLCCNHARAPRDPGCRPGDGLRGGGRWARLLARQGRAGRGRSQNRSDVVRLNMLAIRLKGLSWELCSWARAAFAAAARYMCSGASPCSRTS
mmetsp:Transcript_22674/g.54272  ORF Transcript_22674/g.54272 Transcript_22674/m.54272 type:complete len:217 (+) Transcript_22674:446-1096(+)